VRCPPAHALLVFLIACSRFGAVYPPRPPASPAPPLAEPPPSRIVAHVSVTSAALASALDDAVPKSGEGDVTLLGSERHYTWERSPVLVSFSQGRLVLDTHVSGHLDMRVTKFELPMDLHVLAEPVVNTQYSVRLQSTEVTVTSRDAKVKIADRFASVLDTVATQIGAKVHDFAYELRPTLEEAYARVARPINFALGEGAGCVLLKVLGVEAAPTIIADGIEKDLALVVAPSVTIPCAVPDAVGLLPPLANVAAMASGPFTVTIPVAASYEELSRAMSVAFTDGKLYFSSEYPRLYLETPEIYESQGVLVVKLRLRGPVHKFGIDTDLDGDVYLTGHLSLVDNELRIPDLEPTIETRNLLLSLKALTDGDKIRDETRAALRLDIGQRLHSVRQKLSEELVFGDARACFRGYVDKMEVSGAFGHGTYARVYVQVTARANVTVPCPSEPGTDLNPSFVGE
jgi:hypothetical protein